MALSSRSPPGREFPLSILKEQQAQESSEKETTPERKNVAELLKNERARNAEKAKTTPNTPSAKDGMTI